MEVANDLFSLEARLCFGTSVGHGRGEAGPFKKSSAVANGRANERSHISAKFPIFFGILWT